MSEKGRHLKKEKGINLPAEFLDRISVVARIQRMTTKDFVMHIFNDRIFKNGRTMQCGECGAKIVIDSEYAIALRLLDEAGITYHEIKEEDTEDMENVGVAINGGEIKHALC